MNKKEKIEKEIEELRKQNNELQKLPFQLYIEDIIRKNIGRIVELQKELEKYR